VIRGCVHRSPTAARSTRVADEVPGVFVRAADALDAALGIERSLRSRAWPEGVCVRVRAGIHSGRPTLTDAGYVGLAVHTRRSICSAGHGGQILLSGAARDRARAVAAPPVAPARARRASASTACATRSRSSRSRAPTCRRAFRRCERSPRSTPRPRADDRRAPRGRVRAGPRRCCCTATQRRGHARARQRPRAARLALVAVSTQQLVDGIELGDAWTIAGRRIDPQRTAVINRLPVADRLEPVDETVAGTIARQACGAGCARSSAASATHRRCRPRRRSWAVTARCSTSGRPAAAGAGLRVPTIPAPTLPRRCTAAVFAVDRWTPYSLGKPLDDALAAGLPPRVRLDYVRPEGSLVHLAQSRRDDVHREPPPTMTPAQQQAMIGVARALAASRRSASSSTRSFSVGARRSSTAAFPSRC
jgi:hypothetical protein